MKKIWSTVFYFFILAGLGAFIYWIVKQGNALQTPGSAAQPIQKAGSSATSNSFYFFPN
ncbi:MAG: hypothetical protein JJE22_16140 [Bacteroidia bacterium]|nr:hypothetical protein [Bacteroidia bacterium]